MSIDSYLKNIQSDDSNVVCEAATAIGRLKDKTNVPHLIAAYDEGGYPAFEKRPQDIEGRRVFGSYRDKVIGLAEALWMIGDEKGIQASKAMLEKTIREGEILKNLKRDFFKDELFLIKQFECGTPYFENWRDQVKRKTKGGGCFIATAAFGTPFCDEIATLYRWRDDVLLESTLGRLFVRFYYLVSPSLARGIERSPFAKFVISNCLIKPWCTIVNKFWPANSVEQDN